MRANLSNRHEMHANERIHMRTILKRKTVIAGLALGMVFGLPLLADDTANPIPEQKLETFKGTLSSVDAKEHTLTVKALLFKKTFNVAENCEMSLEDKQQSTLSDLHAGQKVEVGYEKERGVLIAKEIRQKNEVYKGHITAIDPKARTLVVKAGLLNKDFVIAQDCAVSLKDDIAGSLTDLKIGHMVKVVYEPSNGSLAAQRIEQRDDRFVGTIRAIDAGTRTIKAKNMFTEKKFSLASGCRIVVQGSPDAKLSDLRIGEAIAVSFENVDGVLVADRIGHDNDLPITETQTAKIEDRVQ